ncbi:MAG: HAD-IC family P-type ATPase [Candidatus Woesebacteria bacterium]|nr:HAD-IC family P-type ATPase [Candidatus Woesebacteria bacterium]
MFSNYKGLTKEEADARLIKYGKNALPENPPPSNFLILLSQLKNPLVYVLLFAGIISLFLSHFADFLIIFIAVLINTILGFVQENKAGKTLESLKKMVTHTTEVIRDGKKIKIKAEDIVIGDLVVLNNGAIIPADLKIIFSNRFFVDEAVLTGESIPVNKKVDDTIYMGTIVTSGQSVAEVISIGSATKLGNIAKSVQEKDDDTPLKKQLIIFSRTILFIVLGLTTAVFLLGLIMGQNIFNIFQTSVALAVSAIPEGLLVSLTVILAVGMQRILKRNGLVKNLASAETLGGVTTICVDKTGTLTEGKMKVVDYEGDEQELAKQVITANDLDDPIVVTAFEWGRKYISNFIAAFKKTTGDKPVDELNADMSSSLMGNPARKSGEDVINKHQRLDSIPFSSKTRFFTCLNHWNEKNNMLFINGAPEILIEKCNLSEVEKKLLIEKVDNWTKLGRRVIGFARKTVDVSKKNIQDKDIDDFSWVGMLAFTDPVRIGVSEALKKTLNAGIKIMVITGDYPATAKFVLEEIGISISDSEILTGKEIVKLSDSQLKEKVKFIKLFARTTPDQKLKIVNALKENGETVAMMGDGVNDAPALKKADIGIVVSNASDVAKESADLILMDSNFATITASIEEGRGMFENLRKIILYLISDAFSEIVVVFGGILLRLPLPITAVQILWINLVSDGFPNLALTVDNKRDNIMDDSPRSPKEPLVTNWMKHIITTVSLTSGVLTLLFFIYVFKVTGSYEKAMSVAFLTLGINSLVYVFSVKNLTNPFWKGNMFNNKWLNLSVFAGLFLQVTPFLTIGTRSFFGVVTLDPIYWIIAFSLSIFMFIMIEAFKFLRY